MQRVYMISEIEFENHAMHLTECSFDHSKKVWRIKGMASRGQVAAAPVAYGGVHLNHSKTFGKRAKATKNVKNIEKEPKICKIVQNVKILTPNID